MSLNNEKDLLTISLGTKSKHTPLFCYGKWERLLSPQNIFLQICNITL